MCIPLSNEVCRFYLILDSVGHLHLKWGVNLRWKFPPPTSSNFKEVEGKELVRNRGNGTNLVVGAHERWEFPPQIHGPILRYKVLLKHFQKVFCVLFKWSLIWYLTSHLCLGILFSIRTLPFSHCYWIPPFQPYTCTSIIWLWDHYQLTMPLSLKTPLKCNILSIPWIFLIYE